MNTYTSFRYYTSRPFDIIKQHTYTVVCKVANELVGYAHIDFEDKFWVGICIANGHQGKGYGTKLLHHILKKANELHIPLLHLSVDLDNTRAIQMYTTAGFCEVSRTEKYMIMKYSKSGGIITLPVSYGEAFDKLSILDIKLQKIKDDRVVDVQKEYDMIYTVLHPLFTHDIRYHYGILKHINLTIWEQQDQFRDSKDANERNTLCVEIIKQNDSRFLIKHKINSLLQSTLKEQKGYVRRKALVYAHQDAQNIVQAVGTVRYFSTIYDKVYVYTTEENKKALEETYADDPSILVITTPEENMEEVHTICNSEQATLYFHIANKSRNVAILTHNGLGDQICLVGMVNWLATKYKNVYIFCTKAYGNAVRMLYPSPNIHVLGLEFDGFLNKQLFNVCGLSFEKGEVITSSVKEHIYFNGVDCDLLTTGAYSKKNSPYNTLPFTFYIDAGIDTKVFWNFDIPSLPESLALYEKVKGMDYVMIHTKTSEGEAFDAHHTMNSYRINTLVIDIEQNFYTPDHPFYKIAQEFVNLPIPFYKDVLLHARKVFVSDSCLFCLAMNLPLETNVCWIAPRRFSIRLYQYIFTPQYGFPSDKRKPFKLLWT